MPYFMQHSFKLTSAYQENNKTINGKLKLDAFFKIRKWAFRLRRKVQKTLIRVYSPLSLCVDFILLLLICTYVRWIGEFSMTGNPHIKAFDMGTLLVCQIIIDLIRK